MLLKGENIKCENELLKAYSMQELWTDLKNSEGDYAKKIERYRGLIKAFPEKVSTDDADFPYFVTCELNPRHYSTGRFFRIESFCVDVHSFPKEDSELKKWRESIAKDRRVEMMFLSADGKAMHIIFHFRVPCKNEKKYRLFYRNFTREFFKSNNIQEDVLSDACDPRRKISISVDQDAYYCIGAKLVVFEDYLSNEWVEMEKCRVETKRTSCHEGPSKETIDGIKNLLKQRGGAKNVSLTQKDLLSRVDLNINILRLDLETHGYGLDNVEKVFAGRRFIVSQNAVSVTYSLVSDAKGMFAVIPPLQCVGISSLKDVQQILTNYVNKLIE